MADPSLPRTIPCRARDETPGEHALRLLLSLLAIAGLIWLASAGRFSVQQVRSLLANPVIWILMVTCRIVAARAKRSRAVAPMRRIVRRHVVTHTSACHAITRSRPRSSTNGVVNRIEPTGHGRKGVGF